MSLTWYGEHDCGNGVWIVSNDSSPDEGLANFVGKHLELKIRVMTIRPYGPSKEMWTLVTEPAEPSPKG